MNGPKEIYRFQDPFIAAASGLCLFQDRFYVVADDEHALYEFPKDLRSPGSLHVIFGGDLPEAKDARKKIKADFESIVVLNEQGRLLCIPSGSKKNRTRGARIDAKNHCAVTELSFKNVFAELESIYAELNIEGAVIIHDTIRLFQRGNGKLHQNAVIDMNLQDFLKDTVTHLKCTEVNLGKLNDIPLSFTDAALSGDRCFFLAVAENSESTYLDGEFTGAVLGEIDSTGKILRMTPLEISSKPEGLVIDQNDFYIVTDDDDRSKASRLYKGTL